MNARERETLMEMSEEEIRRAQGMVFQQIGMAHEQGNTRALDKLREWEQDYADEMMRRLLNELTPEQRKELSNAE
jgi:hypothetical protein